MGGAETSLLTMLRHRPADLETHAILFEDGFFAAQLRDSGVAVRVVTAARALLAVKRERVGLGGLAAVPQVVAAVSRAVRQGRIDVMYSNTMKAHLVGAAVSRLTGVPLVMHFRDHIEGVGLRLLQLAARAGAKRRLASSRAIAEAIGVEPTVVLYSPVESGAFESLPSRETARAELGLDPNLPTISLIGRINRWKGHDRFVRIAARVSASRPAQFAIVGSPMFRDEDFLPELEALVRDLHLEGTVRFVPWVRDVRAVYAASDIVANCSTREPLGRTPAEAAAAGIPSVVFDDSGAAEWMRDTGEGRIVPAGDEAAFADAIESLLDEGAATHARAAAIRLGALRFEPSAVAEQMAGVIRSALPR